MTVLLGAISEDDQIIIAADSREYDVKTGESCDGALKTVRVNQACAVGYSVSKEWGGQLLANLFGRREWIRRTHEIDVVAEIETQKLTLPDLSCEAVIQRIMHILDEFIRQARLRKATIPNMNVVLVGIAELGPTIACWRRTDTGWKAEIASCTGLEHDQQFFVFGPCGEDMEERVKSIMLDRQHQFLCRIKTVCNVYADYKPALVNRDIWVRRACVEFVKEPLSVLPIG